MTRIFREDDQTQDKTLPKDQRRRQGLIKAAENDPGKIWERQWHLQTNYNKCSVLYGHHHHPCLGRCLDKFTCLHVLFRVFSQQRQKVKCHRTEPFMDKKRTSTEEEFGTVRVQCNLGVQRILITPTSTQFSRELFLPRSPGDSSPVPISVPVIITWTYREDDVKHGWVGLKSVYFVWSPEGVLLF